MCGRHSDDDSRERHKKRSKKEHKKKKKRHRKRAYSSSSSDHESSDHRRRKHHKKKKRRHEEKGSIARDEPDRNEQLLQALYELLSSHPNLAEDLPLMLIRMAGGAAFDLAQTEPSVAEGLACVFGALRPFGVDQDPASGSWTWQGPRGSGLAAELVLVKVMRTMMDQAGFTVEVVNRFEEELRRPAVAQPVAEKAASNRVATMTKGLLQEFGADKLSGELVNLCKMILDGESIALDGLPDEKLRTGLELLFAECHLEKAEIEADSDDKEESEPTMGYGLPEENEEVSKSCLADIVEACHTTTSAAPPTRRVKGPMMLEAYATQAQIAADESDDEGPAPLGAQQKGPALSPELVKARADRRARDLECLKAGIQPPPESGEGGLQREEWMLVPGKFDFLGSIKAGQPIKSRGFQGQSKAAVAEPDSAPIDPSMQAEMDAIMQTHEEARGPSLMELHRQKKATAAGQDKGKDSWKWDRDKDLDAGRRVDKNALNMLLGGASSELKKKFQGGFG